MSLPVKLRATSEADLITLMEEVEDQIIDRLFNRIYNSSKPEERDIFTAVRDFVESLKYDWAV
ncbi:MAG: hypothetical protein AAGE84_19115 [Cyanobacteria bacterium P01_G01_bin.39]